MEVISFENGVHIYRTKIESSTLRESTVNDALEFVSKCNYTPQDNYAYMPDWGSFNYEKDMVPINSIQEVIKIALTEAIKIGKSNGIEFNKININSWINIVRAGLPKQNNFKNGNEVTLHNHIDLQKNVNSFYPHYTFVYYVQMPNNLSNNEGSLIIEGKTGKRYHFLPEVGDLVIMEGYLPHSPDRAPKSTKDRVVIAGNVGLENAKKQHSLI